MRKASGIIYIIILTSFIMFLGIYLISITIDNAYISDSERRMNTAYYIAEGGLERSISIINKDLKSNFNAFTVNSYIDTDLSSIKQKLDSNIYAYFNSFNSKIKLYEFYNNDCGKYTPNGIDTIVFSSFTKSAAYYNTSISLKPAELILIGDGKYKYSILLDMTSIGHFDKSSKEIKAKYTIELKFKTDSLNLQQCTVFNLYECNVKLSSLQE